MLTDREGQVMALIAEGLTSQQIADALGIAPGTVKSHIGALYQKLGVLYGNRVALVLAWERSKETP